MRLIDADALIKQLSVNQIDCPGCPEPEFLPELIEVLKQAPSVQSVADCISRQAAVEVIDAVFPVDPMKSEYAQGIACGAALAKTYVEQLPSAQPDKEKISDALYYIYRNKGTSTSAEGVAAIKYYIAEIWREIYGEEGPGWLKK